MKTFITVLKIVIPLILTLFVVFVFLTFKNSKDCSQIVIDTYEIHSNIDITKVSPINCYYDSESNIRISIYRLRGNINLERFRRVENEEGINSISGKYLLSKGELPTAENLRVATGQKWGRTWTYVYEIDTRRLWAELNY